MSRRIGSQLAPRQRGDVLALILTVPDGRLLQAHEQLGDGVDLPQPDSPTTPSVSPASSSKRDPVDGPDRADLLLEHDALRDREVLDQVRDLQDRLEPLAQATCHREHLLAYQQRLMRSGPTSVRAAADVGAAHVLRPRAARVERRSPAGCGAGWAAGP